MNDPFCPQCARLEARIQQHEKYIAQLVDIIAKTNKRLVDVDKKMLMITTLQNSCSIKES